MKAILLLTTLLIGFTSCSKQDDLVIPAEKIDTRPNMSIPGYYQGICTVRSSYGYAKSGFDTVLTLNFDKIDSVFMWVDSTKLKRLQYNYYQTHSEPRTKWGYLSEYRTLTIRQTPDSVNITYVYSFVERKYGVQDPVGSKEVRITAVKKI